MNILIFDTETTGLDPYENQIGQLSYIVLNQDYNIGVAKNFYFTVNYVEEGASRVTGLTKEKLEKLSGGKVFKDYAKEIYKDFLNADILVAHNISFDMAFMVKEFENIGFDTDTLFKNKETFCTMNRYTDILNIPHHYYGVKYPTLDETMDYLNVSFDLIQNKMNKVFKLERLDEGFYHDARFDVIATMYAYILYERTDGIEMYKAITRRIDNIKHTSSSIVDLSKEFNDNFFGDLFEKEFCSNDIFEEDSNSLILTIEQSLDRIKMNIEKIEDVINRRKDRIKQERDLEIKEYINSKLKDKEHLEIIKGIFEEEPINRNIYKRIINLNIQLLEDGYGQNVDLIELEENTYLMLDCNKNTNILKITKDSIYNLQENEYEVLEIIECPTIVFDGRDVKVQSYITKLGYSKNDNKYEYEDDEIPF